MSPDWLGRKAWEKTHSGMAIVVPVETIVEALEMPELKKQRDMEAAAERLRDDATSGFEDSGEPFTQERFMSDLQRATRRLDEQSDPEEQGTEA